MLCKILHLRSCRCVHCDIVRLHDDVITITCVAFDKIHGLFSIRVLLEVNNVSIEWEVTFDYVPRNFADSSETYRDM
jgi:hypothetical protein